MGRLLDEDYILNLVDGLDKIQQESDNIYDRQTYYLGSVAIRKACELTPTAITQAEWIALYMSVDEHGNKKHTSRTVYKCSNCGKTNSRRKSAFCPNCGCYMSYEMHTQEEYDMLHSGNSSD